MCVQNPQNNTDWRGGGIHTWIPVGIARNKGPFTFSSEPLQCFICAWLEWLTCQCHLVGKGDDLACGQGGGHLPCRRLGNERDGGGPPCSRRHCLHHWGWQDGGGGPMMDNLRGRSGEWCCHCHCLPSWNTHVYGWWQLQNVHQRNYQQSPKNLSTLELTRCLQLLSSQLLVLS